MAESRVPVTLRDFFFDDPFFRSTWDDFEKVREMMFQESRDMWRRFEEDFKKMEASMSSNMLTNNYSSSMEKSSSTEKKEVKESSSKSESTKTDGRPVTSLMRSDSWGFPRRWMFPSIFSRDWAKEYDLFQTKDSDVIRMKEDDSKLEISLDTSQYRPDELRVNVGNGVISVEGKHEEKSQDGHKMVSRMFSRKYSLPAGAKAEDVVSNLSSDGVLVISAPKRPAIKQTEDRNVPIAIK